MQEGESGVRDPNSKSESSWFGVLGNENESPELLFFRRFSMEADWEGGDGCICMGLRLMCVVWRVAYLWYWVLMGNVE